MLLRAENISKTFFRSSGSANYFYAVSPLSLEISPGTVTVLMGRSGSGKTTLLNMLSGLLEPSEGKVFLDETDLYSLKDAALSRLRNEKIGVVPQARSAVDTLTVLENILLPGSLYGRAPDMEAARRWMEALDIAALADARPAELSGGELRRVAIARALTQQPEALLADEPTGDLDDAGTRRVLEILKDAARERGAAVLIVSHDSEAASCADVMARMDGGVLILLSI